VEHGGGWRIGGAIVVTGAARGIGAAAAKLIAQRGATVVLADFRTELLQETVGGLRDEGLDVHAHQVDVTVPEAIEALADYAITLGPLTAWVNNAGIIDRRPLLEISPETFDQLMTVNARGCLLGIQAAAGRMPNGGSIVNLASMSSSIGVPNSAHYGATKAAIAILTKNAAMELGPLGIRVNAVAPGSIRTAFTEDRLAQPGAEERTVARIPLGRIGTPEDMAGPIAFLCSADSRYLNGSIVAVDGGWTAW